MPPTADAARSQFVSVLITVECTPDVRLTVADKERITTLVVHHLRTEAAGRFQAINQSPPSPGGTLQVTVLINRYEEGNAFARAMLAGLGQMHIDADVTLSNWETGGNIAKYNVSKTFAWGGLYGGLTGIKDMEGGFAKAVAASIVSGKD